MRAPPRTSAPRRRASHPSPTGGPTTASAHAGAVVGQDDEGQGGRRYFLPESTIRIDAVSVAEEASPALLMASREIGRADDALLHQVLGLDQVSRTIRSLCSVTQPAERDLTFGRRARICMAPAPHVDGDPFWGLARSRRPGASVGRPVDSLSSCADPQMAAHTPMRRSWVARTRRPAYSSPPTSRQARPGTRRAPSSTARILSAAVSSTRAPAATPSQNSTAARS